MAWDQFPHLFPDPLKKSCVISSETWDLAARSSVSHIVMVDTSVGKDTEITFDCGNQNGIGISLRSPSGAVYDENSNECTSNSVLRTTQFLFPGVSDVGKLDLIYHIN